jgi:hypothetical protein
MRGRLLALTTTACLTAALVIGPPQSIAGTGSPDVTGKVVDLAGVPVQGVRVTAREVGSLGTVVAVDRTNARGRFRLAGIASDELGLRFNGDRVGLETGWLSCFRSAAGVYRVVASWGDACSHAPGALEGLVRMDPAP